MATTPQIDMTLTLNLDAIDTIIRAWVQDTYPGYCVQSVSHSAHQETDWRGDSCGLRYSGASIKLQPTPIR
jgi:hypothetical protein